MRKIGVCVLAIVMFITNVKAASKCSYAEEVELNELAGKIKVSYELATIKALTLEGKEADMEIIRVSLLNLTDKFYVVVSNDKNNDKKTYRASDAKIGVISFDQTDLSKVLEYKFEIYSTDKTGCANEIIDTKYLTTPRFNPFHSYAICGDKEEYELCKKYVTINDISENDFIMKMESFDGKKSNQTNEEKEQTNESNRLLEFLKEYKWYLIGGTGIVLIAIILISVKSSKKRKELEI